jgi:hypothetical protein
VAGKTPRAAVNAYLAPFRRAFDCITNAQPTALYPPNSLRPEEAEGRTFPLTLADGGPVLLHVDHGYPRLALSVGQIFSLRHVPQDPERGPWKVHTEAYRYTLHDAEERDLWAYHYHPRGESDITWPHFHVYAATDIRADLAESHYPTGRMAVEEVLLLLLDRRQGRYGIRALRDDWMSVLTRGLRTFERYRTWSGRGP